MIKYKIEEYYCKKSQTIRFTVYRVDLYIKPNAETALGTYERLAAADDSIEFDKLEQEKIRISKKIHWRD